MVVRCTKRLLDLLGGRSVTLSELPASEDDWYANLLWIDRHKCVLLTHAGNAVLGLPGRGAKRGSPPDRQLSGPGHRDGTSFREPAARHVLRVCT